MTKSFVAVFALLLGVGLALRAPELSLRPMHNDEGVNAVKFGKLYLHNAYKYNPDEFHGPTLPYLTLPAAWLQGGGDYNRFNEPTYRSVTVAFGLGLILILTLIARDLGRAETFWAAVFTAISPAMVFYSRYYIHEMLLVFFTAWTFISFWRYANSGRCAWAVAGGIGLGLMYATKETFVFAVAAMVFAVLANVIWGKWRREVAQPVSLKWKWSHLCLALAAAAVTSVLFFSSFFTNSKGLLDAFRTYATWLGRAGGHTEHVHAWNFYLERLLFFRDGHGPIWSEGFIVALALIGFAAALLKGGALLRTGAFYTLFLTIIYTVLPYKTPWCLLGFYHGMILLAGTGAALLWRGGKTVAWRAVLALAFAAGFLHLGWQTWRGNFGVDSQGVAYASSVKNPYVYSQTLPNAVELVNTIDAIARVSPKGYATLVEVMSPESYWPLPWYLRRFQNVGYWDCIPNPPPVPIASVPIIVAAADLRAGFDELPGKTQLMAGYFALRPQVFLELYVNTNLWASYVKTLPPEKE